jgi:hypothetical protein
VLAYEVQDASDGNCQRKERRNGISTAVSRIGLALRFVVVMIMVAHVNSSESGK